MGPVEAKGRKRLIFIIIIISCVLAILAGLFFSASQQRTGEAMSFLSQIGPGWNLGNTLDAHVADFSADDPEDYESLWGNPATSAELFETVYDAGFRTVRIPVTWYPHLDEQHEINEEWLAHVRRTVDDALGAGLFVILNAHHDAWYFPYEDNIDDAERKLVILWGQICETFADYDERLIFESMNEPRLAGEATEWTGGTAEARAGVNRLNKAFVNTVRAAKGRNPARYLLIPTYAALCRPEVFDDFELPKDDRLGVSIHLYLPTAFALDEDGAGSWSENNADDTYLIDMVFSLLRETFTRKGVPVVLTEYGALDKGNTAERVAWASYVAARAKEAAIPCIWWDNGARKEGPAGTFALLDRRALAYFYPELVRAVTG